MPPRPANRNNEGIKNDTKSKLSLVYTFILLMQYEFMRILLPLAFLLLVITVHAQDLPDIGKLSDIAGKTKYYLVADGNVRKVLQKTLADVKDLIAVGSADDAEFFIQYKMLTREPVGQTGMSIETGQMDVYIWRDKHKIIAWSDSLVSGDFHGGTSNKLLKRFLKARKSTK